MATLHNPNPENEPQMKEEEYRNWADLNEDILTMIFIMVGTTRMLETGVYVCRSWRNVTKDGSQFWRRIDMKNYIYGSNCPKLIDLTKLTIDRSGATLEEFWILGFGTNDLLMYLCERTNALKSLRLVGSTNVYDRVVLKTIQRQPLLEELEMTHLYASKKLPKVVGKELSHLKRFKLNRICFQYIGVNNEEAFGIGKTMHKLRHLQLIGNRLGNEGLKAILEGCPQLETLDIRGCKYLNMDSDMLDRCARLTTLRLPDDYEFPDGFSGLDDWLKHIHY